MKKILIAMVILLLIVAGAVMLLQTRKATLAQAPVAEVLPVVVDLFEVQAEDVTLTLPAMGVVSSEHSTTLSTKISGRIMGLYLQEGDRVKKGDLLLQIDERELRAQQETLRLKRESLGYDIAARRQTLAAAQTALQNAYDSHARTKELLDVKGASIEEYNREETTIAQLTAQVQSAESGIAMLQASIDELRQSSSALDTQLSYARLSAPVDGILSARLVNVGDLAVPGKPLLKIAATKGLYLDLKLPADLQPSAIRYADQRYPLTAKHQTAASGLREYRAPLPVGSTLVEGEFLNIDLILYSGHDLLLPNDVLLTLQGTTYVLIYADGQVNKTPVTVTRRGSEGIMVREDLRGTTLLLAKPDILLRATSGVPVKPLGQSSL